jgi:hypothetical protein
MEDSQKPGRPAASALASGCGVMGPLVSIATADTRRTRSRTGAGGPDAIAAGILVKGSGETAKRAPPSRPMREVDR